MQEKTVSLILTNVLLRLVEMVVNAWISLQSLSVSAKWGIQELYVRY